MSEKINSFILSLPTGIIYLVLILGVGIYLTFKLKFFQIRYFFKAVKDIFKVNHEKGSITPFQAAATALAGTLGTGNIVGVATAITSGGAGAVFWMIVSSLFGMATKYSEILLSVKFREKHSGGPMYYIKNGVKSKPLAVVFSVGCVLASFGVGNISQVNAVSDAFYSVFNTPKILTGGIVALIVGAVIIGGIKRIGKFNELLVPIMGTTYILGSLAVIVMNASKLPEVFLMIIKDAFSLKSVSGGIFGFLTKDAIRFGISRGVFSNEAGMGSSPIAYGSVDTDNAVKQGFWGIIEVFLDTVLMCSITSLVILTSGEIRGEGAAIVTNAFSYNLGSHAGVFVAVSTFFFAVAGIIGWAFYGEKAIEFLTKKQSYLIIYRIVFVAVILTGAVTEIDLVFNLSDLLNLIMAIPNILSLILLRKIIFEETWKYFVNSTKSGKKSSKIH